jgi:hypothetical protein
MQKILGFLRPVVRHLKKNLINDASVPVAALAKIVFDKSPDRTDKVYLVLDDAHEPGLVGDMVKENGDEVLRKVIKDAGISAEEIKKLTG